MTARVRTSGRPPKLDESAGFRAAIATGWDRASVPPRVPPGAAASAAAHRERLRDALPARTVVVHSGTAPVRNADQYYAFRPNSDFLWLTGCVAEDGVFVLAAGGEATLYLQPPAGPDDAAFFADRQHSAFWVGPSPDLDEWARALDLTVKPISEFAEDDSFDASGTLAELRMVKDDWEIEQLREAVDVSVAGFAEVAAELPRAIADGGERWLQGTFERHARTYGAGPGYLPIVGAGPNAAILHWVRCDGDIAPDDVVLLDLGVELPTGYTADITRTVPAGGRFSAAHRQVHDIVERAHRAGIAAVRPGRPFSDFHHACMEQLVAGLDDLGLLTVSVDEALSPDGQQFRRYIVCGVGHHLGLDVHDCFTATPDAYFDAEFAPGMVLTVEPGLYFHAADRTVPPELRGVGIRLEDDLLVTAAGADVLSAALPIDAPGIEQWTSRCLRGDA